MKHTLTAALGSLWLGVASASAQPVPADTTPPAPPAAIESADPRWTLSTAITVYVVPDQHEYVQPTVSADRGPLHLEARYNYEALDTASLWVGCNLGGGETFTWELTPMLGGVFGDLTGIAPGYEATLGWWKFELYSEGEYVLDPDDSSNNFFYNWSEFTLSPIDALRFGVVAQRTHLYDADRDIQRGFLVGVTLGPLDFTASVLNPDDDDPVYMFTGGFDF